MTYICQSAYWANFLHQQQVLWPDLELLKNLNEEEAEQLSNLLDKMR